MVVGKTKLQKGHLFPRIMVEWKMARRQATHLPHNIFRFQVFVGYLFPSTKVGTFFVRRCYLSKPFPWTKYIKIHQNTNMPSKPNNLHFLGVMTWPIFLKALKNPAFFPWVGWGRGVRPQLSPAIIDVRCPQLKFKLKKKHKTGQIWWEGSQKWLFF